MIIHDKWRNNMSTKIINEHIEITPGVSGGKPRIKGHRITVQDIVIWYDRLGKTADEIATEYDLTLADVHGALTYYFDHREEIDRSMQESQVFINNLRKSSPSKIHTKLKEIEADEHGD
jgi:uncharacterized protein (DUF433 family)